MGEERKEKKNGPQILWKGAEHVIQMQWRVPYFGGDALRTRQQLGVEEGATRVWLEYRVGIKMDELNCNETSR